MSKDEGLKGKDAPSFGRAVATQPGVRVLLGPEYIQNLLVTVFDKLDGVQGMVDWAKRDDKNQGKFYDMMMRESLRAIPVTVRDSHVTMNMVSPVRAASSAGSEDVSVEIEGETGGEDG